MKIGPPRTPRFGHPFWRSPDPPFWTPPGPNPPKSLKMTRFWVKIVDFTTKSDHFDPPDPPQNHSKNGFWGGGVDFIRKFNGKIITF